MQNIKKIIKFIYIIPLLGIIFLIFSKDTSAATVYPTTITDIESQGEYHFNNGTNSVDLYASDIINIHNELYSLGVWSATNIEGYNERLSAVDTTITNGKQSVVNQVKSYVSTSATGSSSYATIASLIDSVYTKGKSDGEAEAKAEIAAHPNDAFIDHMYNGGSIAGDEDHSYTNPYGKECLVNAACGGNPESGYANVEGAYVYVNGVLKAGGDGHTSASWTGLIPAGATVRIYTDGSNGTGHGNSYGRVIFVR